MPYCAQNDVQIAVGGSKALLELADLEDEGSFTAAVLAVIAKAIAEADHEIDSYVNKRFDVPLNPVPPVVADKSAKWAARVLRRNRFKGQPIAEDLDAEKIDREWLVGVSNGSISLGINPTPTKAAGVIDKAAPRDPTKAISLDKMQGFI